MDLDCGHVFHDVCIGSFCSAANIHMIDLDCPTCSSDAGVQKSTASAAASGDNATVAPPAEGDANKDTDESPAADDKSCRKGRKRKAAELADGSDDAEHGEGEGGANVEEVATAEAGGRGQAKPKKGAVSKCKAISKGGAKAKAKAAGTCKAKAKAKIASKGEAKAKAKEASKSKAKDKCKAAGKGGAKAKAKAAGKGAAKANAKTTGSNETDGLEGHAPTQCEASASLPPSGTDGVEAEAGVTRKSTHINLDVCCLVCSFLVRFVVSVFAVHLLATRGSAAKSCDIAFVMCLVLSSVARH
jgi:hypothetical protein